ncbi:MAG: heme-binding protein [Kofleriaceae bacterium]
MPSIFDHFPRAATTGKPGLVPRRFGLWFGVLAAAAGAGAAVALGSHRRALLAGGAAALALGALRIQLARWFTATTDYEVEAVHGAIEVRRYPMRIEARAESLEHDFETALDKGYGQLSCYVYGANAEHEDLERTTPVMIAMHDGVYTTSFVMPPNRTFASLPRPEDMRVELREMPERRIAALRFHGRFTRDNLGWAERRLLRALVDAGLSARGSVVFAAYDTPATLPFLRRNELWIEVV